MPLATVVEEANKPTSTTGAGATHWKGRAQKIVVLKVCVCVCVCLCIVCLRWEKGVAGESHLYIRRVYHVFVLQLDIRVAPRSLFVCLYPQSGRFIRQWHFDYVLHSMPSLLSPGQSKLKEASELIESLRERLGEEGGGSLQDGVSSVITKRTVGTMRTRLDVDASAKYELQVFMPVNLLTQTCTQSLCACLTLLCSSFAEIWRTLTSITGTDSATCRISKHSCNLPVLLSYLNIS